PIIAAFFRYCKNMVSQEREFYDPLGCPYHGHPDPRHLLSFLHDALPISINSHWASVNDSVRDTPQAFQRDQRTLGALRTFGGDQDRKSTRLNSSHVKNSYAVFCLKKKNDTNHV